VSRTFEDPAEQAHYDSFNTCRKIDIQQARELKSNGFTREEAEREMIMPPAGRIFLGPKVTGWADESLQAALEEAYGDGEFSNVD
jgi:hypothetical protein